MASKLVTSIDIGFSSVKVAQFETEDSGPRLVSMGIASYPREQVGQPSTEVMTQALRSVIEDNKMRVKSAFLSIPRSQITSKRLSNFPNNASVEQIANIVSIQAEAELPFGGSEIVYDYQIVQHEPTQVLVDLVGARKQIVDQYLEVLVALDIEIDGIVPSTGALGFLAAAALSKRTDEGLPARRAPLLVVDIGAGHTDLVLIRGRRVVFSRSFPVAGDRLTQAYAAGEISFQDAESAKHEQARLPEEPDPTDPTVRWATNLVRELELSVQASAHEIIGDVLTEPDEIWFSGGGAQIPGLTEFVAKRLEESFEVPPRVELWDPLAQFAADTPPASASPMAVAAGLGVQAASDGVAFSLIPKEVKQRRVREQQQKRVLVYAASAFVVVLALVWAIGSWVSSRVNERGDIEDELARTRPSYVAVEAEIQKDLALVDMLEPKLSVLDVLLELSNKLPARKELAARSFTLAGVDVAGKGTLIIQVEANAYEGISKALTILQNSPLFDSARSGQVTSTEKDKRPIFQAQINCVLAADANSVMAKRKRLMAQEQVQLAALPPSKPLPEADEETADGMDGDFMPMMEEAFMPLLLDDEEPDTPEDGGSNEEDSDSGNSEETPPASDSSEIEEDVPTSGQAPGEGREQVGVSVEASNVTVHPVEHSAVTEIQVEAGGNQ